MTTRHLLVPAVVLPLVALAPAGASAMAQTSETIHLAVGASKVLTLSENPSTGYKWHMNTAHSSNLAAVRISDLGYQHASSHLLGAPGTHRWRITGGMPGHVRIVFDYLRPWEHGAPAKRHVVNVEVTKSR